MKLNFKSYNFTTKQEQGNTLIFDIIRKGYFVLTPEEWVRQHVLCYLVEDIGVPKGLISVERAFHFNGLQKRFDVVVANSKGELELLIECKAPYVNLDNKVLHQAGIYQKNLGVKKIFLTNGIQHVFLQWNPIKNGFEQISSLAPYSTWF
ncbi:MAG: type I restriction enzyme HsdR N-terminal domain-containing protein [Bacteroidia bacterium]